MIFFAASPDFNDPGPRSPPQQSGEREARREPRLVQGRPFHRLEVELGKESSRAAPSNSDDSHPGSSGSSIRGLQAMCSALRGEPMSCHEAVEYLQQPSSGLGVGSSGCLLPARTAPTQCTCEQAGAVFRRLVREAQLGNRGNHCYANSLIRCVMWLCADMAELQVMVGVSLFSDIKRVLDGRLHFL